MAVLETKYVTAGVFYYVNYGYMESLGTTGSVSDTSGGSNNNSLTDLYSNSTLKQLLFSSQNNNVSLYIDDASTNVTNGAVSYTHLTLPTKA